MTKIGMSEEEKKRILEIAEDLKQEDLHDKHERRKLKFGKKMLLLAFGMCLVLILFVMAMIYQGKDTSSLSVLATAGVGCLPIMYGIYTKNATEISKVHMEKNYIPDYDEKNNIY